jgi:hypothetical protein
LQREKAGRDPEAERDAEGQARRERDWRATIIKDDDTRGKPIALVCHALPVPRNASGQGHGRIDNKERRLEDLGRSK